MKTTINSIVFAMCLVVYSFGAFGMNPLSRSLPDDAFFYHPTIQSSNTAVFATGSKQSSSDLQNLIDKLAQKGGGVLTIKSGTYRLIDVYMRSNVHIRFEPNVVIKLDGQGVIFWSGEKGHEQPTENWSFTSTSGSRLLFDFRELNPTESARVFSISNATNFKIADFNVMDNYTKFSCVTFGTENANNRIVFASKGIVENIETSKGHYGYGVVQCQVGQDLLFRNIKGEGGAALRFESGLAALANLKCDNATIDRIFARDIACSYGQCAITMSPHVIKQGWVDIRNVKVASCEAGAVIAAGFLSNKKNQSEDTGFNAGTFSDESVLSDMHVVYGDSAQIRPSRLIFIPCKLRSRIVGPCIDQESILAPSLAPVFYLAAGKPNTPGYYKIVLNNITSSGFSADVPADGIIFGDAQKAITNCDTPLQKFNTEKEKMGTEQKPAKNKSKKHK